VFGAPNSKTNMYFILDRIFQAGRILRAFMLEHEYANLW